MRRERIVLGSVLLLGIGGFASLYAQHRPQSRSVPTVRSAADPLAVSPIVGYKNWTRVNRKPHEVTSRIAMMCMAPTQEEVAAEAANPHLEAGDHPSLMRTRFVTVYVNKTAEQAILHAQQPVYPEGSLIVKERSARPTSAIPELITVMHKREPGYNPGNGDWEYLTLDGAGKQITAQGRLHKCESCHAEWKQTDYTSRAYLSASVTRHLR